MQVIVHGGAGTASSTPNPRQKVLDIAAETGAQANTPLEAVEKAVNILESDPQFNAGYGSVAQVDGQIRTDAGIMTSAQEVGAVTSITGVTNTISVAKLVLEQTPHITITGQYAERLAEAYDINTDDSLITDQVLREFESQSPPSTLTEQLNWTQDAFGGLSNEQSRDHDTVGAVAVNENGDIAAGTSTGGRWFALAGRIGDSPQIGAGYIATPTAGVSATGAGEEIAQTLLSNTVSTLISQGLTPDEATDKAIEQFEQETGEQAGVIALDNDGNIGSAFNSEEMQTSHASD